MKTILMMLMVMLTGPAMGQSSPPTKTYKWNGPRPQQSGFHDRLALPGLRAFINPVARGLLRTYRDTGLSSPFHQEMTHEIPHSRSIPVRPACPR